MRSIRARSYQILATLLLVAGMAFTVGLALPAQANAEDAPLKTGELSGQDDANGQLINVIMADWISGQRQPASGGMFAWYAATYSEDYYTGERALYEDLKAEDFMLQVKPEGGKWTDVPGRNLVVTGDFETCDIFEAIVAALIPDNEDPYYKQWRVVYLPDNLPGEAITQNAKLVVDENVRVSDYERCRYYEVEQLPWSKEEYEQDHIPPIYLSYVNPVYQLGVPTLQLHIEDPGLEKTGSHMLYPSNSFVSMPFSDEGPRFVADNFELMKTDLSLGDLDDDESTEGIAGVVRCWEDMSMYGMFPSVAPDAKALYDKLAPYALNPDDPASTKEAMLFWVSGAGTQERIAEGVTDYLLVVVFDEWLNYIEYTSERHVWGEPTWEWTGSDADGYTAAVAEFKCEGKDRSTHYKQAEAELTDVVEGETRTYTATVMLDGVEYSDTKSVANTPQMNPEDENAAPASGDDGAPAADRVKQMGEDGTAVGKGASLEAAEAAILASNSEEGPAGTKFAPLKLRSVKQAKRSVTAKWDKVPGAAKYVVYGAACGKGKKMQKIAETAKTSLKVTKVAGKKLAKGRYCKLIVVAVDGSSNVVSTSKVAHACTKGGKSANPIKVTTKAKKGKVALKAGKSFKLKAKQKAKKGKVAKHRKLAYETSDPAVASVSKKGVIKGEGAGTCYIYAYAQNGVFAKVKVTVK